MRVTFRLRTPNASDVAVAIGGKRLPMQKDEQGLWSLTTDPMAPDIYTYSLVVDGAARSRDMHSIRPWPMTTATSSFTRRRATTRAVLRHRQFKGWLKSKGVEFTEQEVPDVGHVWPLWRQNLTDMVPRLFQPKGK